MSDDDKNLGPQLFVRSYPLEDIKILSRAQGAEYADGRTVEAYVAVFDREAEIHDPEGHYLEVIDRTAFNKAIQDSRPQGSRQAWRTSVFYNHGMTLYGTPSDKFSVPIGSPVDVRVEDRGLLTVTRYNKTPLADEILEAIGSGDITGHSFTGRIIRSDPQRPPSRRTGYQRSATGTLQRVRRLELGLKEYGPTPFPAYIDAELVGVRSMLPTLAALLSTTQDIHEHVDGEEPGEPTPTDEAARAESEPVDSDTPEDGAVTDEPPEEGHSSRDSLLQRIAAAKTIRPRLAHVPADEARRARTQAITAGKGPE